ncbi:hypothetical protein PsorP6_008029 [Peronosclerospora sorghi]|uniref:Uncharacterized protein n=1 Tax=Peronosclerospora sorghi TaxID=230839 RepID=A0ACC0WAH6_9STRA|nr:hypothetical protein PsorP6_008029 [Peronosclerospora sorghi]
MGIASLIKKEEKAKSAHSKKVDEEKDEERIVFDEYTVATVESFETKKEVAQAQEKENTLIRKPGSIEGKGVTILLDCGASTSLIREGIVTEVTHVREVNLEGFDGIKRTLESAKRVIAFVEMNGQVFRDMKITESSLSGGAQDVIFW